LLRSSRNAARSRVATPPTPLAPYHVLLKEHVLTSATVHGSFMLCDMYVYLVDPQ
jgi:hypothetical protein